LQVDGVAAFDALLNKLLRAIEAKQHSMAHA
jgi:hypothetical protein